MKKDFEIRKFKFSHIFKDSDDQNIVFKKTAIPILDSVIEGYNGCIMAYGQTGTGKTHTILGKRDGLLPKALEYIFYRNNYKDERFVIDISCLQIYMENLTDLFDYKKKAIQIREKNGTFVVTNSVWVRLNNYDEAIKVLEETENRRKSCSTNMNQFSSRSHAIFIIKVTNIKNLTSSNLFLVDLAGSERIKKSYAQGDRLEEAISINTSLMALSKCIYGISENKWSHIPYRESKLTKILQETLAGNGKTVIIITISPDHQDIEETISSLKFGQRASKIYCTPKICKIENDYLTNNMFILDDQKKILEEENLHLREQCKKLLKIVESTASKNNNNQAPKLTEEECQEISKDLKSILDGDSEETIPVNRQDFERLIEENEVLKARIDNAELQAFDNMRLTYEEVENNLYAEINELKQTNKKNLKLIATLNKKIEDLSSHNRESEGAKREVSQSKRSGSRKSLRSGSTLSHNEDSKSQFKLDTSLSFEPGSLAASIIAQLKNIKSSCGAVSDEIVSEKMIELLQIPSITKNDMVKDDSYENKENKEASPERQENIINTSMNSISMNNIQYRGILSDKTHQNTPESINKSHKECNEQDEKTYQSKAVDAVVDQYKSASDEEKQEASKRMASMLEGLITDVDRRCNSLTSVTMSEEDALESISSKLNSNFNSFVKHSTFISLLEDLSENRESILKVAINIIIDSLVKRMISLRFSEKKVSLLDKENKMLKGIVFEEEIIVGCVEVIRKKNLSSRAARKIQAAYRKYRWRKAYNKTQRPKGMFDWGHVRAGMGKENIQMLLQEVEGSFDILQKFFCNNS